MQLVLITPPENEQDEIETIEFFVALGFKIHIRKPRWNHHTMKQYLALFNHESHKKFSIHGLKNHTFNNIIPGLHLKNDEFLDQDKINNKDIIYSKSIHTMLEYEEQPDYLSYVFLSPIFDSISKKGYRTKFDEQELSLFLSKKRNIPVYALGGMSLETFLIAKKLGFDGVAFMGEIWGKSKEIRKMIGKEILKLKNH